MTLTAGNIISGLVQNKKITIESVLSGLGQNLKLTIENKISGLVQIRKFTIGGAVQMPILDSTLKTRQRLENLQRRAKRRSSQRMKSLKMMKVNNKIYEFVD